MIVVENRNVYLFVVDFFYDKIIRCFDVFKVYCFKVGFECIDDVSKFFGVGFIDFDVKIVDICEFFEENCFVFYYWFVG